MSRATCEYKSRKVKEARMSQNCVGGGLGKVRRREENVVMPYIEWDSERQK